MSDLPEESVRKTFPFNIIRADIYDLFYVTYKDQRKNTKNNIYICMYNFFFVNKVRHLEVAADMTLALFIAALKKFIFRRDKCAKLFSNNAEIFVGLKGSTYQ